MKIKIIDLIQLLKYEVSSITNQLKCGHMKLLRIFIKVRKKMKRIIAKTAISALSGTTRYLKYVLQ